MISYRDSLGWGTKIYATGSGHMTKMAAMPIHGKHLKKTSSPNQKADLLYGKVN